MDSNIYSLLADRGSLTERFKQMMGQNPKLVCLSQKSQLISRQEGQQLGVQNRQMALVREIIMGKGEQQWMFARTVIPQRTLRGPARRIAYLNDTPIGNILFGRNGASRKSMQVELTCELPESLIKLNTQSKQPLWQRQSIFEFSEGPLMVTELFLPGCPIY